MPVTSEDVSTPLIIGRCQKSCLRMTLGGRFSFTRRAGKAVMRAGMRFRFSILLLFVLCFAPAFAVAQAFKRAEREAGLVLLLYAERAEAPAIRAIDAGLREALAARGGVEVFAEYFDFSRFPAERHAGGLIDSLLKKWRVAGAHPSSSSPRTMTPMAARKRKPRVARLLCERRFRRRARSHPTPSRVNCPTYS